MDFEEQAAAAETAASDQNARPGLYIVGFNIDARRASYHRGTGALDRVTEGVYISTALSSKERTQVLQEHGVRIAHNARPNAILAGPSAYHHAVVGGYVTICREFSSKHITIDPSLTVYSTRLAELPMAAHRVFDVVTVSDPMGEFKIRALTDEMLILEAFTSLRTRPQATMLNSADLHKVIERAYAKHGSVDEMVKDLTSLAKLTKSVAQLDRATDFLRRTFAYSQTKQNVREYAVFWNRNRIATLLNDGSSWSFDYTPGFDLPVTLAKSYGTRRVPSFIASLLPEAKMRERTEIGDGFKEFSLADRYASNITVRESHKVSERIIVDSMVGTLKEFSDQFMQFTGSADLTLSSSARDTEALARAQRHAKTPRMSGMQAKLPVHLDMNGVLSIAHDKAFTHIAKISPAQDDMCTLGSMEWFTMTLAALCGIKTERFAVADLGARSPAFVAERFDIRSDLNDRRMILAEDMWSIMGQTRNDDKYDADLMRVADIVRQNSTAPDEDAEQLFRMAAFSWLAGNSDMHLKNLMMVKVANEAMTGFTSIRLSPAYDMVCTQVYPLDTEAAALTIGGKNMYTAELLKDLGRKLRIDIGKCDEILRGMVTTISDAMPLIGNNLPPVIAEHQRSVEDVNKACMVIAGRCLSMHAELSGEKPRRRLLLGGRRGSAGGDAQFAF